MKAGVVAFAFGVPETLPSNILIARIASQRAHELKAPVYTQLDIRLATDVDVEYTKEVIGNPPPTLRIARGAVCWARQRQLTGLWLVAARPHLGRCLRDLKRTIRQNGYNMEVLVCQNVYEYPEEFWYCPDSTQERVRSSEAWGKRERILRIMPFWLYSRVAK